MPVVPLEELTGNFMFSRKGQCKWTCRLTPFWIAFILLLHLVISVNILFSFIWAKLQNLHTHKKKGIVCPPPPPPHPVCLSILAYHLITGLFSTNSVTMLMPSDVIYSWHHHALSNKNILKRWLLSAVHISWFVYHLIWLAKFTHTTEANILLG